LSSLGMALSTEFWQLIVFRFLLGVSSAIHVVTAQIALADLSTTETRAQYLSLHSGSRQVGNSLGPAFGGFVAQFFGLRAPFYVYAGMTVLASLWTYFFIPETSSKQPVTELPGRPVQPAFPEGSHKHINNSTTLSVIKTLVRDSSFLLITLVVIGNFIAASGGQQTILPLYGHSILGMTEGQLGLAMTLIAITTLVTVFMVGWLSDKVGRKVVIVPGVIGLAVSLTLFGLSKSIWMFMAAAVVMGLSRGIGGSIPAAYAADIAPPGQFGITLGLFRTFGDVGFFLGPILMGWLADTSNSLSVPLFATTGFLIAGAILFGLFARETVQKNNRTLN
ncbi:MAG: MFS transporter, partial [Dehalococcoidia bacterium]|nr:MFS transporter [Dehalococcoidia bacterium]